MNSIKRIRFKPISRVFTMLLTACAVAGFSSNIFAWGHDGHGTIGILSVERIQPESRIQLELVLGSLDNEVIIEACNWPDAVRETDEWAWSYPLHFVNLPEGESRYLKSRDCPEQLCATEAIKKYALQLGDRQASQQTRQQAFAWICHLTGDLHQPLHAGFAKDRGGNDFDIFFNGEEMNLHGFWDQTLINQRAGDWQQLNRIINDYPAVEASDNWSTTMVNRWTEESHKLVQEEIYPQDRNISKRYQEKSWGIIQQRINTAASRLALIINSVL